MRAKLGLKLIEVGPPPKTDSLERIPALQTTETVVEATNPARNKITNELREKLEASRERRTHSSKLSAVRGLGEADEEEGEISNARDWVNKLRSKELAEKQAQSLAYLNTGISALQLFSSSSLLCCFCRQKCWTSWTTSLALVL